MATYPKQFISQSEKDDEWKIESIDYFCEQTNWDGEKKKLFRKVLDAINGEIPKEDYTYVTNPINSEVYKHRGLPARIRNYNILRPAIMLMLGEFIKRGQDYLAINRSPEMMDHLKEKQFEKKRKELTQQFINQLNELGVQTGVPTKEVEGLQTKMQEHDDLDDELQMLAQSSLDLAWEEAEIDDEIVELFYYYLALGEVATYKTVHNDKVVLEAVNPLEISYDKDGNTRFIKDGNCVVRRKYMQINQILDYLQNYKVLNEDTDWEDIEQHFEEGGIAGKIPWMSFGGEEVRHDEAKSDRYGMVEHLQWRSHVKVGILTTTDPLTGEPIEIEVSEDYELSPENGDISLDFEWRDEIREGYRIDEAFHLGGDVVEYLEDEFEYNGFRNTGNVVPWSVGIQGYPYQLMYDIMHFRGELAISKHKGTVIMMPYELAPDSEEFGMDEFFYHIDALNFGFYEATGEGREKLMSIDKIKAFNVSMADYISTHYDLMQSITAEFERSIGITPQRKGDIAPSEKVGNMRQAVDLSATINEEIFYRFERFFEKDLNQLIGMTRYAWINGKKKLFLDHEYRMSLFEILPEDLTLMDIGVYLKRSGEEQRKLETLRSFGLSFAQNVGKPGITASLVANVVEANSFAKIKKHIERTEKAMLKLEREAAEANEKRNQQNVQAQAQAKQMEAQAKAQEQERSRMHESIENEKDRILEREKLQAETGVQYAQLDANNDGVADTDQVASQIKAEAEKSKVEAAHEANEIKREELAFKERDSKRKVQIAKENKNRHDK